MKCLLALLIFASSVIGANPRLNELNRLKRQLPLGDHKRAVIDWELAGLLAADAESESDLEKKRRLQLAALRAYQDLLKGTRFQTALKGEKKYLAIMQSANLRLKLGQDLKGLEELKQVLSEAPRQGLQMKSAVKLAEYFDQKKNFERANDYFERATELCEDGEICPYLFHRWAWTRYRLKDRKGAIQVLRQALWAPGAELREEAARDLVAFLAELPSELENSLQELAALSEKAEQDFMLPFSDALAARGLWREAREALQGTSRSLEAAAIIRLLNLNLRLGDWENYRETLATALSNPPAARTPIDGEAGLLRDLAIRLEGETKASPVRRSELKATLELYLAIFLDATDTARIAEAYLAAESEVSVKLTKLNSWLAAGLLRTQPEARRKLESTKTALELTQAWQLIDTEIRKSKGEKNPEYLLPKIKKWLEDSRWNKEQRKELLDTEAKLEFNWALQNPTKSEALDVFLNQCRQKTFFPDSCRNAATLSQKQNEAQSYQEARAQYANLVEQIADLELLGDFKAAALFWQKRPRTWARDLRIALLLELSGDTDLHKTWVGGLREQMKSEGLPRGWEIVLFKQLQAAGLIDKSLLEFSWPRSARADLFPFELDNARQKQSRLRLSGSQSEQVFARRVDHLKRVANDAQFLLPKASPANQVIILEKLSELYRNLAEEILATEVPQNLSKGDKAGVQRQIVQAAEPFQKEADRLQEVRAGIAVTSSHSADLSSYLRRLRAEPWRTDNLQSLVDHFRKEHRPDLEGYFAARIQPKGGIN